MAPATFNRDESAPVNCGSRSCIQTDIDIETLQKRTWLANFPLSIATIAITAPLQIYMQEAYICILDPNATYVKVSELTSQGNRI